MALDVPTLRALFRHLQALRAVYEDTGIDSWIDPDGIEWCIWDLETLYSHLSKLPPRQHQAIELCFVQNRKEAEAAVMMGVSHTNPVSIYANNGLTKLIAMVHAGLIPRFACAGYVIEIIDIRVKARINLREGNGAADSTRNPSAVGRGSQPADPGVAPGSDQALSEVGHPDPLEGGRPASAGGLRRLGHT